MRAAARSRYISPGLAALPISEYSRREQFPYWVNLYNALTVDVVLDHYPVATIMDIDISPGWFANGPWGKKLVEVEGENPVAGRYRTSHPQAHLEGSPHSFRGQLRVDRLSQSDARRLHRRQAEAMLEAATRDYANHPRGAHVADGKLYLSSIFDWYGADFGDEAAIAGFIRRYAEPPLAAAIGDIADFRTAAMTGR